ncbi:MAG: SHOCT domain-containing protein [Ilumatobacteraceae bacterium]
MGRRSTGTITAIEDTGTTINNSFRARVDISVDRPDGTSFPVHRTVSISRMALPRIGDRVTVAHSPDDPMDFVYRVSVSPSGAPASGPAGGSTSGSSDRIARLKELAGLRDSGVLSDSEFEAEKQRLLSE